MDWAIFTHSEPFRFVVLVFNCLLTLGGYFCFDMPSVLENQFCSNETCKNDNSSCQEGLGMSPAQYNLLYAVYAWTNAVIVIGAGYFLDKLGNKFGCFLFSGLVLLGSATFALGSHYHGTPALFPLMMIGRLLFGAGNGSLTIVQNRITAYWFKGKELALAFGITLAFSRLGSVLNFFLTSDFESKHGIQFTLWGGTVLCGLSFLSAIIVSWLDTIGMKYRGEEQQVNEASRRVKPSDVLHLSKSYWLIILSIMFFYNGVFPFVADASKFIADKYSYSEKSSAYVAGAVYYSSLILASLIGITIDYIGMRGLFAFLCAVCTIPVFVILGFTTIPPLVGTMWLGITYSFAAASLWPSIPLVVPQSFIGTAMGLATSLQMVGIGISNLVVGQLLGEENGSATIAADKWMHVMWFMLANVFCCVVTTTLLNMVDWKRGWPLNRAKKRRGNNLNPTNECGDESEDEEPLLSTTDSKNYGTTNSINT